MPNSKPRSEQAAIRTDLGAIFVSMELSRSTGVITALATGGGEKMSRHSLPSGNVGKLLERFARFKQNAHARTGVEFPIIVIQEAGLDGFWIHRVLESEGIESYVVDPASILTSRRRRRAKTDTIDGETLVRTLMVISAENLGCAPWSGCQLPRKRIAAGSVASARSCWPSGSNTSTASKVSCSPKGSSIMNLYVAIVEDCKKPSLGDSSRPSAFCERAPPWIAARYEGVASRNKTSLSHSL